MRRKNRTRDTKKHCGRIISSKYKKCKSYSIELSSEGFLAKLGDYVRFFFGSVSEMRGRESERARGAQFSETLRAKISR